MNLRISGQPRVEPLVGRIPMLRIALRVESAGSSPNDSNTFLLDIIPRFSFLGIDAPQVNEESVIHVGTDLGDFQGEDLKYLVPLQRGFVEQVERARINDVPVTLSLQFRYLARMGAAGPAAAVQRPSATWISHAFDISQAKWLESLDKAGYFGAWVLEVQRPTVEGWTEVVGFLKKAEERIVSHDAEGAIAQCRAAWNSVKPLLEGHWDEVATEIDRGSTKEQDYPLKSKRVKSLWEWSAMLSNIGDHPESYAATMSDAFLAYQTTSSLVAYFSRKYTEAERRKSSPIG